MNNYSQVQNQYQENLKNSSEIYRKYGIPEHSAAYLKQVNLHSVLGKPDIFTDKLNKGDFSIRNSKPDELENFLRKKPKPWYLK